MKKILLVLCLLLASCTHNPKYYLYVYYSPTCRVCDSLIKLVVNDIEDYYKNDIEVILCDIDVEENIEAYAKTCTLLEGYVLDESSGDVPFLVLDGYFAKSGFDVLEADDLKQFIIDIIDNHTSSINIKDIYYFKENKSYRMEE